MEIIHRDHAVATVANPNDESQPPVVKLKTIDIIDVDADDNQGSSDKRPTQPPKNL